MSLMSSSALSHLIETYGYWALFGLLVLESAGLPLPGETALVAAALYAGTTHRLDIALVILAAAGGAVLGYNIGFWVGREFGLRLVLRYGRYIGLDERRLKLGHYLFLRHGGKIVFFGRFVALLRAFAALLAGINRMPWRRFLLFNACGGILWAMLYGLGGYLLGHAVQRFAEPVGLAALVLAVVVAVGWIALRRREQALVAEADGALPGPLYGPRGYCGTARDDGLRIPVKSPAPARVRKRRIAPVQSKGKLS
jgi:membrane protein DedA with SNARE-associated domain